MAVDQQRLSDYQQRLAAAAQEIDDLQEQRRVAQERRDRLIVEAIDEHLASTKAVARMAHISQSRVMSILANPPAN